MLPLLRIGQVHLSFIDYLLESVFVIAITFVRFNSIILIIWKSISKSFISWPPNWEVNESHVYIATQRKNLYLVNWVMVASDFVSILQF